MASATLEPDKVSTPGVQVSTFAVDGAQSKDIVLVKRVPTTAEGPNFLLFVPDKDGKSFHEFNTREEMTAWLKEQVYDPEKLEAFASHFSIDAAPGQVDRVKEVMTRFAADDINAVVGSYCYEKGDIFTRLHKDVTVAPVDVNGLTQTRVHQLEPDGKATYIGTREDGQSVLYKYDAYGNLHGASKGNFYFVRNGLNNDAPLVAMTKTEYLSKVINVSLDNVGANDKSGIFHEFLKQLRNPGEGLGTALTQLGVPPDIAHSIEEIVKNPGVGSLHELNRGNRLGDLFGIDQQTTDEHLRQVGIKVQGRIPHYNKVREALNSIADFLETVGPEAPDMTAQVNTR
ncbi:Uncharacterised protein [Pseudomonas fluorescens]|uniref:Dermonecrotic toxin N-terminal domain-containing protein n=2 Tax=Pseudomonas fluorescens TaxID=294 RepID=A0A379IDJ8_PSEFL|nr:DUF6543 domain-containing protein [Pseudomonas fluorescens]SUD30869.1 Uncharacterised protein [Pseudomonas fluorescens]